MIDNTTGIALEIVRKNGDSETFEYVCGGKRYAYYKGDADPLDVVEKLFSRKWAISRLSQDVMPGAPFNFYLVSDDIFRFSEVDDKGVVKNKEGKRVYWDFPLGEAASNVKNGNWRIIPKGLVTTASLQNLCDKIPGLVVIKEPRQVPLLKFRELPEVKVEGRYACSLVKVLWALSDEIV